MRSVILCSMIAAAAAVAAGPALAQGKFTPLGVENTYVAGMSADGSVVVGVWGNEGPAWRWTAETGVVDIGSVSQQVKISRDGRTIVGTAKDAKGIAHAAIWQSGKQWITLPPPANGRVQDGGDDQWLGRLRRRLGDRWFGVGKPERRTGFPLRRQFGDGDLGKPERREQPCQRGLGRTDTSSRVGTRSKEGSLVRRHLVGRAGALMNPFAAIGQVEGINDCGSVLVGRGIRWTGRTRTGLRRGTAMSRTSVP